jgi:hypothetical protein
MNKTPPNCFVNGSNHRHEFRQSTHCIIRMIDKLRAHKTGCLVSSLTILRQMPNDIFTIYGKKYANLNKHALSNKAEPFRITGVFAMHAEKHRRLLHAP